VAIYLDSARLDDARMAGAAGFVAGITTNPTLLAEIAQPREAVLAALCTAQPGPVFCQLVAPDADGMVDEAHHLLAIAPAQVVLKVPAGLEGLRAIAALAPAVPCALTAVYAPGQAYLAAMAGARYVIPYVNRATRRLGDGVALVEALARTCAAASTGTEILAASLKTPDEVTAALLAGAHHVTLPWPVIAALAEHPLSVEAAAEFGRAAGRQAAEVVAGGPPPGIAG
jgi:transaldolase